MQYMRYYGALHVNFMFQCVEDFKSFVLFALTDVIEISFAIPLS